MKNLAILCLVITTLTACGGNRIESPPGPGASPKPQPERKEPAERYAEAMELGLVFDRPNCEGEPIAPEQKSVDGAQVLIHQKVLLDDRKLFLVWRNVTEIPIRSGTFRHEVSRQSRALKEKKHSKRQRLLVDRGLGSIRRSVEA